MADENPSWVNNYLKGTNQTNTSKPTPPLPYSELLKLTPQAVSNMDWQRLGFPAPDTQSILNNAILNTNATRDRIYGTIPQEVPAQDSFNAMMEYLTGYSTADTSGYDAALGTIANQRKQTAKRYQTYTAQLSDLFGNLGRKSDTYAQEQTNIGQNAELLRSQVSAQQTRQAEQTRAADAIRLKTANEARVALGGTEAAIAGAGGDIATQQGETALTDQQALGQTTIDTILANEALAKLMSSNQASGIDLAGIQAKQQLNTSYEDMLASLANAEAQTKMQKSQAISAGAPTISDLVNIANSNEKYNKEKAKSSASTDPATIWLNANAKDLPDPNSGLQLLGSFVPWYTEFGGEKLSTDKTKNATFSETLTAFKKANAEGAALIDNNPSLISLLRVLTELK